MCCSHLPDVSLALQKCAAAAGKDVSLRSLAAEVLSVLTFAAVEDPLESDRIAAGLQTLATSGEACADPSVPRRPAQQIHS